MILIIFTVGFRLIRTSFLCYRLVEVLFLVGHLVLLVVGLCIVDGRVVVHDFVLVDLLDGLEVVLFLVAHLILVVALSILEVAHVHYLVVCSLPYSHSFLP